MAVDCPHDVDRGPRSLGMKDAEFLAWLSDQPPKYWSEEDAERYAELTGQTWEILSTDSSNELMRSN